MMTSRNLTRSQTYGKDDLSGVGGNKTMTSSRETRKLTSRFLLALSSLLSAAGGAIHAAAFRKALTAINASDLPHFYAGSSKALWLGDSTTLFIVSLILGVIAARPSKAMRAIVVLVALAPLATAILIYTFLGGFFAGHVLLAIAALALLAGMLLPGSAACASLEKAPLND